MGGCVSAQKNAETRSFIDDFLDIFKNNNNTAPSRNDLSQVPRVRSTNYENTRSSSVNIVSHVRNNDFLEYRDIFKTSNDTAPSRNDLLQVPRVRSTNFENDRSSSLNTLSPVRNNNDILKYRVRNLDNRNLEVRKDYGLMRFDENYFPKASKVVSIDLVHLYNNLNSYIFPQKTFKCVEINQYCPEYLKIKKMITNKYIRIRSIEEINNPFLRRSYQLKKEQKKIEFPLLKELQLFHGTKKQNIDNICENNFNWRLYGKGTGHRFGQGISFSCNAMYAATYSSDTSDKVMFLSYVLVGEKCVGSKNMKLPPNGYDTTLKNATDHIVVVKYEDNEFYPAYKIKFNIAPGYTPRNKRQNVNHFRRARTLHHSFSYDSEEY